eukprot:1342206-Ditylum_brightwellii.AAC.1
MGEVLGQYACPEDYDDYDYDDDTDAIQILLDLYFDTGGPTYWINAQGWADAFIDLEDGDTVDDIPDKKYITLDFCNFYGIECDADGEVLSISLGDNNMQGLISENIFDLPKLKRLDLGGNNIWFDDEDYGFGNIGNAVDLVFLNVTSSGIESFGNIDDA